MKKFVNQNYRTFANGNQPNHAGQFIPTNLQHTGAPNTDRSQSTQSSNMLEDKRTINLPSPRSVADQSRLQNDNSGTPGSLGRPESSNAPNNFIPLSPLNDYSTSNPYNHSGMSPSNASSRHPSGSYSFTETPGPRPLDPVAQATRDHSPQYSKPVKSEAPGSSDFVRKLYSMLQDMSYADIVKWNEKGDSFIVLDTNSFTNYILPKHFKHCNFSSFVRQLNKYDFHKVRTMDEDGKMKYGTGSWEFKHPDFQMNKDELLENIKRKPPTSKKTTAAQAGATIQTSGAPAPSFDTTDHLQKQINDLKTQNHSLTSSLDTLYKNHAELLSQVQLMQESNDARDDLLTNLVSIFTSNRLHVTETPSQHTSPNADSGSAHLPISHIAAQRLVDSLHNVMKFHLNVARDNRAESLMKSLNDFDSGSPKGRKGKEKSQRGRKKSDSAQAKEGHGMPSQHTEVTMDSKKSAADQSLVNSSVLPKWAVPPKVLLVEDDVIARNLSFRFLKRFGCDIDFAADGLTAVDKMNQCKYDIVLMDIMMPNLDGVSATNLIRQFDQLTPIISMTSNVQTGDVMNYFSNGMNDVLAKPFTKDGLKGILDKHLIHLKAMKSISNFRNAMQMENQYDSRSKITEVSGNEAFPQMNPNEERKGTEGNNSANNYQMRLQDTFDCFNPNSLHNDGLESDSNPLMNDLRLNVTLDQMTPPSHALNDGTTSPSIIGGMSFLIPDSSSNNGTDDHVPKKSRKR
ncbi:hypothetical protein CANCADRAFT_31904 [Tortispora caseinolytica NRRL Y-17796]|uniref:Heat shock transcription factor n=1 Tax=Tortispora caseinolytica NRRL Y-17796 TaxID=767744 RepID=A0A1E4THJ3_9ASCO|nr:hypothetical protein CANCADRAFT_31904 [Tortispora caseinolytica NRRL Y-17796]